MPQRVATYSFVDSRDLSRDSNRFLNCAFVKVVAPSIAVDVVISGIGAESVARKRELPYPLARGVGILTRKSLG